MRRQATLLVILVFALFGIFVAINIYFPMLKNTQKLAIGQFVSVLKQTIEYDTATPFGQLFGEGFNLSGSDVETPFFNRHHFFNCKYIFDGDQSLIDNAKTFALRHRSEGEIYNQHDFCYAIRKWYYFPTQKPNPNNYSLAYVIKLNGDTDFVLKLLQAIYSPNNYYCFHVDLKAPQIVSQNIRKLVSCFFNTILTESISNVYASWLSVQPYLNCINDLLQLSTRWEHVIILEGHDFPLKTVDEMSYALKTYYKDSNDVEFLTYFNDRLNAFEFATNELGVANGYNENKRYNNTVPKNITLYKNIVQASLTRKFANYALGINNSATKIKQLHQKVKYPDESYWSTLLHNPVLNAPGSFPPICLDKKDFVTRKSYWYEKCETHNRNGICIIGLEKLSKIVQLPHFFINKFLPSTESVALECAQEFIFNKSYLHHFQHEQIDKMFYNLTVPRFIRWNMTAYQNDTFCCEQ